MRPCLSCVVRARLLAPKPGSVPGSGFGPKCLHDDRCFGLVQQFRAIMLSAKSVTPAAQGRRGACTWRAPARSLLVRAQASKGTKSTKVPPSKVADGVLVKAKDHVAVGGVENPGSPEVFARIDSGGRLPGGKKKTAIITGASSGLGLHVSARLGPGRGILEHARSHAPDGLPDFGLGPSPMQHSTVLAPAQRTIARDCHQRLRCDAVRLHRPPRCW